MRERERERESEDDCIAHSHVCVSTDDTLFCMQNEVAGLIGTHSMGEFFKKPTEAHVKKRTVLIMDEVDGMTGSDRGGIAELIQLIKKSKVAQTTKMTH
jgi:hypothetical protein